MPVPELSVIIGSFNQKEKLILVLDSLTKQTLPVDQFEVVIVDSGSKDSTKTIIPSYQKKLNLTFQEKENRGKSSARNQGARSAKGTYLFFTDADMIAHPQLLEAHLTHQKRHPNTVFEGATFNIKHYRAGENPSELHPYIQKKLTKLQKLGWFYFLTGNLSLPKALFLKAEGFDEDFQGYGWEDLELGYRLAKQKIPLLFLPQAKNYHLHPLSREAEVERKFFMGQSAMLFLKKHPSTKLKWFLGMNPLSMWLHEKIPPRGKVMRWLEKQMEQGRFKWLKGTSHYLLQEYNYLSGVKSSYEMDPPASPAKPPDVSIIIANYNRLADLKVCLPALLREQDIAMEIIVVDDTSQDSSVSFIRENFPQVKLAQNKENLGFAKTSNRGATLATSPFLLFLNTDTEVREHAICTLVNYLKAHPQVGAVGPKLFNLDGSPQRQGSILSWPFWKSHRVKNVSFLPGTCFLIRKDLFETLGCFDESYIFYNEDLDLCKKITRSGYQIHFVPQAEVVHFARGGQSMQNPRNVIATYKGSLLYCQRYYAPLYRIYRRLVRLDIRRKLLSPQIRQVPALKTAYETLLREI